MDRLKMSSVCGLAAALMLGASAAAYAICWAGVPPTYVNNSGEACGSGMMGMGCAPDSGSNGKTCYTVEAGSTGCDNWSPSLNYYNEQTVGGKCACVVAGSNGSVTGGIPVGNTCGV